MENITSQEFGRCLVPISLAYEQPSLLKPIFLFNKEVFIPARGEIRLGILQNLTYLPDKPPLDRILKFFDLYEFDKPNLTVWLWLIYSESNLRTILRDRLSNLRINWKTVLIKSYPEGFLKDDFTSEEGLNFAAEKAQEVFVGSALATQSGLTFCGNGFQAMLSTLPIYGKLPIDLFKESLYIKALKHITPGDKEAFTIIQNFAMSNYKSNLNNSGIKSLPLVLTREFPAIHDLDFKQIIELRDENKINSFYQWLLRWALKKNFDIKNETPDSVADFLQYSLWELASSVEPNISSEISKIVFSNIPIPLPINPIGITTGINDLIRAKKVKEEFEGLFILSSLFASKNRKRH